MIKIKKPNDKLYCEKCGKMVDYKTIEITETLRVKEIPITIKSKIAICKECGNHLFEPYYENLNLKKAYKKYSEINNLILPNEIKRIRQKYGLSQEVFATILGIGKATIQRYERGSLPSKVNSNLIKRAKEPYEFYKILEEHKKDIPNTLYRKLRIKLKDSVKTLEKNIELKKLKEILMFDHPDLDLNKLKGVVASIFYYLKYIFNQKYINKNLFLRLLWLVEKESELYLGKKIMNLNFTDFFYGLIPKGSVGGNAILIEYMVKDGMIEIKTLFSSDYTSETYNIKSTNKIYKKYLTLEEDNLIENIIKKYANKSIAELMSLDDKTIKI